MYYKIIIEPTAEDDLWSILTIKKIQTTINSLSFMPNKYKNILYIEDGKTKDLIYQGYTICYHVGKDKQRFVKKTTKSGNSLHSQTN